MAFVYFRLDLSVDRVYESSGDVCEEADRIPAVAVARHVLDVVVNHAVMMVTRDGVLAVRLVIDDSLIAVFV